MSFTPSTDKEEGPSPNASISPSSSRPGSQAPSQPPSESSIHGPNTSTVLPAKKPHPALALLNHSRLPSQREGYTSASSIPRSSTPLTRRTQKRPKTTDVTARRLIAGALGIRSPRKDGWGRLDEVEGKENERIGEPVVHTESGAEDGRVSAEASRRVEDMRKVAGEGTPGEVTIEETMGRLNVGRNLEAMEEPADKNRAKASKWRQNWEQGLSKPEDFRKKMLEAKDKPRG